MDKELFIKEVKKLGIDIDDSKLEKLDKYYKMLIETNRHTNLTRITEESDVYLKHFYDSLTIVKVIDFKENLDIIDIGTGAGFPGIILKIMFPNLKITLLDSLNKRIEFLNSVIKNLDLKDIIAVHDRIENYNKEFDIVVSRAVAKTNILLELSCQLVKTNGYFIFLKGNIKEELEEAESTIKTLNLKLEQKEEFMLPIENSNRAIIKIKKLSEIDKKYPRNFAKIKEKPL